MVNGERQSSTGVPPVKYGLGILPIKRSPGVPPVKYGLGILPIKRSPGVPPVKCGLGILPIKPRKWRMVEGGWRVATACYARKMAHFRGLCYGLLLALLMGCQPAQPPVQSRPDEQASANRLPEARYQALQPTLTQQDEQGNTLWKLQANTLEGQSGEQGAEGVLREVQGWLYRDGKPILKFSARYARAHSERREVEAWGKVQAVSSASRARLQAERILWKAREDKIIATGGVIVQWGELTVRDDHLVLDTALQRAWGGQ